MFKFFSARLSTLGLEQLIFLIFCNLLNINQTIITLASQVIIFVSNYLFSKLLVFKKDGCDK